ncbi:protein NRT1/ PTR FAMILY 5.8-like [Iris pallida]|uniref:Protein NRT1/ PTR FAMILY 5.8-like n=1 Tax=Iris pallida TaxID=29817 RepID=A0AAX6I598_IRIPA|nr:protein NRT1/ PTR FAMILY 5.8-like [Iris pallida]KAJ6848161.1 protein NRT1/ PTR FAMILY 5.8-like [Iris pallida]
MDAVKRSAGLNKSCILIIVVAGVERFAYKGVASNLVTFLTNEAKMSTSSAAKSVSAWSGLTSMLPLITAVLADSYWDRYSTIAASSLVYIVGLFGLALWALLCAWMPASSLFLPLYLISIGQGGYNPSLQAFGADQLGMADDPACCREEDETRRRKKSLFFQWWYFGICSGSLLGNSLMSYVQDNVGWGAGFAIPAIAMSLSVACFLCCAQFYEHKKHANISKGPDSSVVQSAKIFVKNIVSRKKVSLPQLEANNAAELELQEKPLREDFECPEILDTNFPEVDEAPSVARVILRLLPIWIMLLMFAVIFQQPATFFTKQGVAMKHTVGGTFVIPPAMLQSATTISIILLMPLYDRLIIPVLLLITRSDKGINVLQRMGIGMLLSVLAMIVAALAETKRLGVATRSEPRLSIFWLLPQYILLGVSDVFTVVGMQEFFYTQVPSTMRTIGVALYLSVFGVGSFLSALLISAVEMFTGTGERDGHSWFSDDMREARLDKYYWFLALLSFVSFLMFASLCRYYDDCSKDSTDEDQS